MPNNKPTRDQFRAYVVAEFTATCTNYARGLIVGLPAVHLPFLLHVAQALGLDVREPLTVGDRAQLQVSSFRRTPRAVVAWGDIPAAAMRQFNNRHED